MLIYIGSVTKFYLHTNYRKNRLVADQSSVFYFICKYDSYIYITADRTFEKAIICCTIIAAGFRTSMSMTSVYFGEISLIKRSGSDV